MKILELRLCNLNSLYGEWRIDFDAPAFRSDRIFALVGPTGAGKSTILDAICLALYGATPRLGKINVNNNAIISRHSVECYAEVVFSTTRGRYRCNWQQHRVRRDPTGKLSEARHEISDADSGELLAEKKTETLKLVEAKTGMDFERFTRSMLLAQGAFDSFLKADVSEKSLILEQITGSAIYGEISQRVQQRHRDEKQLLAQLQAAAQAIALLEPEQEQQLRAELQSHKRRQSELDQHVESTQQTLQWRQALDAADAAIAQYSAELDQLDRAITAFAPKLQSLQLATSAADLEADYRELAHTRQQQQKDKSECSELAAQLPRLQQAVRNLEQKQQQSQQQQQQQRAQQQQTLELIKRVRALDQQLQAQQQASLDAEKECRSLQQKLDSAHQQSAQLQQDIKAQQRDLSAIDAYQRQHAADQSLATQLPLLQQRLQDLHKLELEQQAAERSTKAQLQELHAAERKLEQSQQVEQRQATELAKVHGQIQAQQQKLEQLLQARPLAEYRKDKDQLQRELQLQQKIISLQAERERLVQGQACPLCGALEHPFARGDAPNRSATERELARVNELIEQAEALERAQQQLQSQREQAQQSHSAAQHKQQLDRAQQAYAQQEHARTRAALEATERELAALRTQLSEELAAYGYQQSTTTELAADSIQKQLSARAQRWQEQQAQRETISKHIAVLQTQLESNTAQTQQLIADAERKSHELTTKQQAAATSASERQQLFGAQDPDSEERRWRQIVAQAESAAQQATTELNQSQARLTETSNNSQRLQTLLKQRAALLEQREDTWRQALEQASFADEAAFVAALLPSAERAQLQQQQRRLQDQRLELNSKRAEQQQRRRTLAEQRIASELDAASLQRQLTEARAQQQAGNTRCGELEQRLRDNEQAQRQAQAQQQRVQQQRQIEERWHKLNHYIGSGDGKKFRNFAQSLNFEIMVANANSQLRKLSDRYLLVHDPEQALELQVLDNYQAGAMRPTKNLSGGESFIVSLALALGLAQMASHKTRVDSLFIDEGFGSLDPDSLDTALNTLAELQQDDKLIGIISHVTSLQERIPTQIAIIPQGNGRSRIQGPGVSVSPS